MSHPFYLTLYKERHYSKLSKMAPAFTASSVDPFEDENDGEDTETIPSKSVELELMTLPEGLTSQKIDPDESRDHWGMK